jgi:hypothetical protein
MDRLFLRQVVNHVDFVLLKSLQLVYDSFLFDRNICNHYGFLLTVEVQVSDLCIIIVNPAVFVVKLVLNDFGLFLEEFKAVCPRESLAIFDFVFGHYFFCLQLSLQILNLNLITISNRPLSILQLLPRIGHLIFRCLIFLVLFVL